jgi:O-antigen ligase
MSSVAYGALWIFIFALPWERLVALPGLYIVTRATGVLALGLALFAILMSGRIRRWKLFQLAAVMFVTWTGFATWWLHMTAIPQKLYTFVQLVVVLWLIWELAPTVKRMRGLLTAFVLGAFVPAVATILLYVEAGGSMRRFSAGGADPNSLANTLALAMPMAWYLSITTKRPLFVWICRAYVPIGLMATVLTGSRGGLLSMLVALTIIPFTMKLSPGRLTATLAMLALSGALVIAYAPESVVERLSTTTESAQSGNLGGRVRLWVAGVHAFTHKPMMGYGVGQFKSAITPELGAMALVAHNSFLSVLVEEGIIGLILYLTMFFSVLYYVLHYPPFERRFGLVLYGTLGTAMLPLTWEDQKAAWFVMAVLTGFSILSAGWRVPVAQQTLRRPMPLARPPLAPRGVSRANPAVRDLDPRPSE